MHHREDIVKSIGYSDGYFNTPGLPKLWQHWDWQQKMWYNEAKLFGRYTSCKRKNRRYIEQCQELALEKYAKLVRYRFTPLIGHLTLVRWMSSALRELSTYH